MIRKAENKDIEDVMRLLVQVNDVHAEGRPDLFVKGHTKYTPEELKMIFADRATPVFVETDETGRVLGYCFCMMQDNTADTHRRPIKTLYIDDLCVDEACRGMHVGRRLYDYVRKYAESEGCYNLTLNVWQRNESAMEFYRRLGLLPQKTCLETIL